MKHRVFGYVWEGLTAQTLVPQLKVIGETDRVFEERSSPGYRADRVALTECLQCIRAGDQVRVPSLDRLAISIPDLRDVVAEITAKGAFVVSVQEQQTFSQDAEDIFGRLAIEALNDFATFEQSVKKERQANTVHLADTAANTKGHSTRLSIQQVRDAQQLLAAGVPKTVIARGLGINRSTLYQALRKNAATKNIHTPT
jgi:DNA invertase Pin-like site-specific DNA recombinase